MACGGVAGALSVFVSHPIDTVRATESPRCICPPTPSSVASCLTHQRAVWAGILPQVKSNMQSLGAETRQELGAESTPAGGG